MLIFPILFLAACAQSPERPASASTNSKYSFEQLHQAALYGTTLIVNDVNAKFAKKKRAKIFVCDPSVETMNLWVTQLHGMIDVKSLEEQTEYLSASVDRRTSDPKLTQCEKKCLCGAYSQMIGAIEEQKLSAKDLSLKEEMLSKHSKMTPAQEKSCVQAAKWFCGSELYNTLKNLQK